MPTIEREFSVPDGLRVVYGYENMDFVQVTALLGGSYWSPGIGEETVRKAALHSALLVGVFDGPRQIAYARVISDTVTLAYLADVIVHEGYRGRGVGRGMLRGVLQYPELAGVYSWLLGTRDAQGVYAALGFSPLPNPEKWMLIQHPRPHEVAARAEREKPGHQDPA